MYPFPIVVIKFIIFLSPYAPALCWYLRHSPLIRTQMQVVCEVFHAFFTFTAGTTFDLVLTVEWARVDCVRLALLFLIAKCYLFLGQALCFASRLYNCWHFCMALVYESPCLLREQTFFTPFVNRFGLKDCSILAILRQFSWVDSKGRIRLLEPEIYALLTYNRLKVDIKGFHLSDFVPIDKCDIVDLVVDRNAFWFH